MEGLGYKGVLKSVLAKARRKEGRESFILSYALNNCLKRPGGDELWAHSCVTNWGGFFKLDNRTPSFKKSYLIKSKL
jgi:hypothetical protein